uniref:Molybdenum cofactor sulfurase n=1 Tax=Anthurium amnicola TaxID=1678845 RepID=A0A1D1ZL06_9ARAE
MEQAKGEFLRQFGEDYGYPNAPKSVEEIRASEFKRLEGLVYLDHAGSTLYSETQMEAVAKDLTSNVYGNPHSQSDSSMASSDKIAAARQQVLDFCNASPKEYTCIFTSGATAALKLIGEAFPWSRESCFMYTMENHNSVLGIREYALDSGASALAVDIDDIKLHSGQSGSNNSIEVSKHSVQRRTSVKSSSGLLDGNVYSLFAFPSECNFSGWKFHLDLVNIIKENAGKILEGSTKCHGRWMVLIDAAKGCATEPPDLARFPADFVVLSFYKIFGYPTGLGALIVRNEAAKLLKKTYFGGGTVLSSIANIDFVKRRECIEQLFEDGTLSFLSLISIHHGFKIINMLTVSAIARHTASLATYVRNKLMALKHDNGAEVCLLYGRDFGKKISPLSLGPTIAFNLKRLDGSWFGHREVEKLASLSGIQLRTGCFCNPGACAKYLGLSQLDLISNFESGHVCWDDYDILHGKPTGAVRISFGFMSVFEDARKFLRFIEDSFLFKKNSIGEEYSLMTKVLHIPDISQKLTTGCICLKSITIYPIKSCSGFSVDSWPLSHTGLRYDREWLLKGLNGEILTQKKAPEMSKIYTLIDLKQKKLILESPNCRDKLQLSIERNFIHDPVEELDVYGQRYEVNEYDNEVNKWFTTALARSCVLVRCQDFKYQHCMNKGCRDVKSKMNFVNEAQILLISLDSISDLDNRLRLKHIQDSDHMSEQQANINSMRFRPNLVVSGSEPFAEDNWTHLNIGKAHFTSLGGCNRCQMINLDPLSGHIQKSKEPLATLASFRRVRGKILFGILLRYEKNVVTTEEEGDEETWLQVGQEVSPQLM